MDQTDPPGTVDLVPADRGLSSLGLLMQLGGHVLGALAVVGFSIVAAQGLRGRPLLWVFAVFASSAVRSMLQLAAGKQLIYGEPGEPGRWMVGVRRYIKLAVLQSLGVAVVLWKPLDMPTSSTVAIGAGLLVWPIALHVVLGLSRFRGFDGRNLSPAAEWPRSAIAAELPITEDKGFEGASIVMMVFGLVGTAVTAALLWILFRLPDNQLRQGPNVLVLLATFMLFVRAVLHAHAGLSGLRTTSLDHSVEAANRYSNVGVISSFSVVGAMFLFAMASQVGVIWLATLVGLCWMLLAWPVIIRRFFADRQFADLLAGNTRPIHCRSRDAGLTWLGWFLFALAAWSASFLLPLFVMQTSHHARAMGLMMFGQHSPWWNVGLVVLQAWAGFELIRMSPVRRVVATVYGAIAIALTLYLDWPVLGGLAGVGQIFDLWDGHIDAAFRFALTAISIILPLLTIVLVHRTTAPVAHARIREKSPGP